MWWSVARVARKHTTAVKQLAEVFVDFAHRKSEQRVDRLAKDTPTGQLIGS